jgi:hypothetical protein
MSVQGRQAEGHKPQVALDRLHADVVRNDMAPYRVVGQSADHDADRR